MDEDYDDAPLPPHARFAPALDRYDDAARAALAAAQEATSGEASIAHVIAALLADPKMVALAEKRGGEPARVRAACAQQIAMALPGARTGLDAEVVRLLRLAEDEAPNLVRPSDIVIAGLHLEFTLFREAFQPPPPRPPAVSDDDEPPAAPTAPTASDRRGSGPLVLSRAFERAFALAVAIEGERGSLPKRIGDWLPAWHVIPAERELEATLPDDFWAACAARLPVFFELGVAMRASDDEPPRPNDVCGRVLMTAQSAESEVEDDLVVIMDRSEMGADTDTFVCVKKRVPWERRNEQPVYVLEAKLGSEREEYRSFGDLLRALLEEAYPDIRANGEGPAYAPRLA